MTKMYTLVIFVGLQRLDQHRSCSKGFWCTAAGSHLIPSECEFFYGVGEIDVPLHSLIDEEDGDSIIRAVAKVCILSQRMCWNFVRVMNRLIKFGGMKYLQSAI